MKLGGKDLENVESFKYLGLWFDRRLTWNTHISKMVDKCKRVLNVMRCLCGVDWGASRVALKTIYTGLIRSVIDYGCMVYGSAANTTLKQLDVIQNQALRVCCGAMKTTPVAALQVEMGEMPLHLRRDQLEVVYWANLKGHNENHIAQTVLMQCQEREKRGIKGYGWTIQQKINDMEIDTIKISPTIVFPVVPTWLLDDLEVDFEIMKEKQENEIDSKQVENYIREKYSETTEIYTDASRIGQRVGVSFSIPKLKIEVTKRINNNLAVYTAELVAIWLALKWVEDNKPIKAVIASDSSSALISIKNVVSESRQDIIYEIVQLGNNIIKSGVIISLLWVPAHIGVSGNEMADKLAKQAAQQTMIDMDIKYSKSEIKSIVKTKILGKWQHIWNNGSTGRQYYTIQNIVGKGRETRKNKKEEDKFSRMRFNHTSLNSTLHMINKHADGMCECNNQETVEHVLMHCPIYQTERNILFTQLQEKQVEPNIKNILKLSTGDVCFRYVYNYLKDTGLINRI